VCSGGDGGALTIKSDRTELKTSLLSFTCNSMELKIFHMVIKCARKTHGCFIMNSAKGVVECSVPFSLLTRISNIISNGCVYVDFIVCENGIILNQNIYFYNFSIYVGNLSVACIEKHLL
jgi:hypothetical protein